MPIETPQAKLTYEAPVTYTSPPVMKLEYETKTEDSQPLEAHMKSVSSALPEIRHKIHRLNMEHLKSLGHSAKKLGRELGIGGEKVGLSIINDFLLLEKGLAKSKLFQIEAKENMGQKLNPYEEQRKVKLQAFVNRLEYIRSPIESERKRLEKVV
jgi:tetrahydromethanopterin S-methyltransferase subunit G